MSRLARLVTVAAMATMPFTALAQSTGGGASSGGAASGGASRGGGSVASPSSPSSPSGGSSGGGISGGTSSRTLSPGAPLRPSSPALRATPPAGSTAGNNDARSAPVTQPTAPGTARDSTGNAAVMPQRSPATSGAPPQADTQAPIGPDARQDRARVTESPNEETSGGSSRTGATGKTMDGCMAAWDRETHMAKEEWRRTCRRTLEEPHI